jgi:hypothetical protein
MVRTAEAIRQMSRPRVVHRNAIYNDSKWRDDDIQLEIMWFEVGGKEERAGWIIHYYI